MLKKIFLVLFVTSFVMAGAYAWQSNNKTDVREIQILDTQNKASNVLISVDASTPELPVSGANVIGCASKTIHVNAGNSLICPFLATYGQTIKISSDSDEIASSGSIQVG